jgi:hypothetical protein
MVTSYLDWSSSVAIILRELSEASSGKTAVRVGEITLMAMGLFGGASGEVKWSELKYREEIAASFI